MVPGMFDNELERVSDSPAESDAVELPCSRGPEETDWVFDNPLEVIVAEPVGPLVMVEFETGNGGNDEVVAL